jgi:eukaryotic-like serine/threonine-protein kinase
MVEPDTIEVDGRLICRLHHTPLVFDPNWAFMVTWDSKKGNVLHDLKGHKEPVLRAAWRMDGKRIITGSGVFDGPGETKVWDAKKGIELLTLKGHTSHITSVAWSPDGNRILTGHHDSTATVWDAEKGVIVQTLKGHRDSVFGVAWSPDGTRILTASWDQTVKVWKMK